MIIYPYKKGLNSTAKLRDLGCRVRYATSRVKRGVATSWGNRTMPEWGSRVRWINNPLAVPMVADKRNWAQFCQRLGEDVLTYTDSRVQAEQWAAVKGQKVVCRTLLNSSGGRGIVVARKPDEVVDAPLYSLYFKKAREYRVLFGSNGELYYAASKRNAGGVTDTLIRTTDNGWTYQVEPDLPEAVENAVAGVAGALAGYGLNLLAYDVAYDPATDTACVIEANTAPGLNDTSAALVLRALEDLA